MQRLRRLQALCAVDRAQREHLLPPLLHAEGGLPHQQVDEGMQRNHLERQLQLGPF